MSALLSSLPIASPSVIAPLLAAPPAAVSSSASAAERFIATAKMAQNPSFFDGKEKFNHAIYVSLDVVVGFTILALIVSLAALGVQLARKDQRKLAQKTVKAEGVYFLPHSPILAPVMVSCYCIVAIATALVLRAYLWRGSALVVIQRLSLLLPTPLLFWAWYSASANAFAWHLTPPGGARTSRYLRFKPMTLNVICWVAPLAIFLIQLVIVGLWPIKVARSMQAAAAYAAAKSSLTAGDPRLQDALDAAYTTKRIAELYYQSSWGVWAVAYGACWVVYTIYSCLLLSLLSRQMAFVDTLGGHGSQTGAPVSERSKEKETEEPDGREEKGQAQSQSIARKTSATFKHASSSTLKLIRRSSGSDLQYISKRELLRRNSKLVAGELIAYSVFTLAWMFLAIVKAVMGYRILNNPQTGPITVLGELYESTIFGLVVVTLLLVRGVNILRNRKADLEAAAVTSTSTSQQQTASAHTAPLRMAPSRADTTSDLATRRGNNPLSISLNVGSYVIVGPSNPTTPSTAGRIPREQDEVHLTLPTLALSPGEGCRSDLSTPLHTPAHEYFELGSHQEKGGLGQVRRKSSVTFLDEVLCARELQSGAASLGAIVASPRIDTEAPAV